MVCCELTGLKQDSMFENEVHPEKLGPAGSM